MFNKLEREKNVLNLMKGMYEKSTSGIMHDGESLNTLPLRWKQSEYVCSHYF